MNNEHLNLLLTGTRSDPDVDEHGHHSRVVAISANTSVAHAVFVNVDENTNAVSWRVEPVVMWALDVGGSVEAMVLPLDPWAVRYGTLHCVGQHYKTVYDGEQWLFAAVVGGKVDVSPISPNEARLMWRGAYLRGMKDSDCQYLFELPYVWSEKGRPVGLELDRIFEIGLASVDTEGRRSRNVRSEADFRRTYWSKWSDAYEQRLSEELPNIVPVPGDDQLVAMVTP